MARLQRVGSSSGFASRIRGPRPVLGALIATVGGAALVSLVAPACDSSGGDNGFNGSTTTTGTNTGSSGNPSSSGGTGGDDTVFDDAGIKYPVTITPSNPILKLEVPLGSQTIQFVCTDTASGLPVDAKWTLDSIDLGTLSPTGLFTPNGKYAGEVKVRCDYDTSFAETTLRVLIHATDNQGGLTQQQIQVLDGPPGLPDVQWQFLYPYDNTVFPRGILAPEIHLTSGSSIATGFAVSIHGKNYEYEGYFNTNGANTQLQMSQDAWEALANSAAGETVEIRVSKLSNGQKYGPIFRRWTIAKGKLHGTIYYNTYDSPLAGTGAMMRIKGNSPTPEVLVGNCTVCHSISSDGSTAAAANHSGPGGVFDLTGGNVNPPLVWTDPERASFAGIYPKNGEVLVINGAPGPNYPPNTPGTGGTWLSELRTKNGTLIPNSGIESFYAQSPVFSHDGTKLAFTDRSGSPQHTSVLAIMDYDAVAQKFSNYQVLATPKQGHHLAWPAFTPDGKYVLAQDGTGEDLATWNGNTGHIVAVDVQTKQMTYLSSLNGDGYMPQLPRDENKNYEPTIAPIGSGGYFWVMFTSRRTYGNKLTDSEYSTKRLWVSALDINAPPGKDGSHPGFYIAGQELTSGNSRGFWALDVCKNDGSKCESGDECCGGFCTPNPMSPGDFVCEPPNGCSNEFNKCVTSADCCENKDLECINGSCTTVPPE